jgi:hypothetical protein
METISQARKVIEAGLALLSEKDQMGLKYNGKSVADILQDVMGMLNKDDEKIAMTKAWATQEANRIIGVLWRAELLPEDLEKEYRKLPKMDEAAADYNEFLMKHREEAEALEAERKKYADRQRELDIFQGVLGGRSKEEAEKGYDQYQQNMAQAMGAK